MKARGMYSGCKASNVANLYSAKRNGSVIYSGGRESLIYNCKKCSYNCFKLFYMTCHIERKHIPSLKVKCPDCGKSFKNRHSLESHKIKKLCMGSNKSKAKAFVEAKKARIGNKVLAKKSVKYII